MTVTMRISRFAMLLAAPPLMPLMPLMGTLVAAAIFAIACGSTGGDAPPNDGGVGDGSALSTSDSPAGDDRHDPLDGIDAGCPIKTDGPRSGKSAASVARAGTASIAWSAPENARNLDGLFAQATLDDNQATEHLRITDFGFAIPAGATIKGVEVELKRQASDLGIGDGNIEIWLDGTPSARPKLLEAGWPRQIVGTHHYGQAVDTWGNDLTTELVGRPGFGVEIYALRQQDAGTGPVDAKVESMRITIFYCD